MLQVRYLRIGDIKHLLNRDYSAYGKECSQRKGVSC
jgi:hypothetical protein